MDKVIVITVCRNAGILLEPTILSVLNQKYQNIQYVIVDGGSTDKTVDIIKKYADHIAAWVSEADNGIYDAMNKGLSIAKSLLMEGETAWVNFMNAGDSFSHSRVISDVFMENTLQDVKVLVGHYNQCFGGKKIMKKVDDINLIPSWMPFCHQATFVRLEVCTFDTSYKIAADYNLFYQLYDKFGEKAFLTIDRVIADFRMEDSTTYNNLLLTAKEGLQIRSKHKNMFWWKLYVKYCIAYIKSFMGMAPFKENN